MAEGLTGVFFDRAEPSLIADAIRRLPTDPDRDAIRRHAEQFAETVFIGRMQQIVNDVASGGDTAANGR